MDKRWLYALIVDSLGNGELSIKDLAWLVSKTIDFLEADMKKEDFAELKRLYSEVLAMKFPEAADVGSV